MKPSSLIRMMKLAEKFVYSPEENVVFTGKSLRDILYHLRSEIEATGKSEDKVVAGWEKNVGQFRDLVLTNARQSKSTVEVEGRAAVLVREDDAAAATSKCPKGPDYHYPSKASGSKSAMGKVEEEEEPHSA